MGGFDSALRTLSSSPEVPRRHLAPDDQPAFETRVKVLFLQAGFSVRRERSGQHQQSAMLDPLRAVNPQDLDCRPSRRRLAHQDSAVPFKVLGPDFGSGIEQLCHFTGLGIISTEIWSFCRIAVGAGPTKVLQTGRPVVFSGADVIQFVRQGRKSLGKLAVFATVVRLLPHLFPERGHQGRRNPVSETRALACNKSRNWPTRRYFSSSARCSAAMSPALFASSNSRMRSRAPSLKRSERIDRAASSDSPGRSGATTSFKMSASVTAGALITER